MSKKVEELTERIAKLEDALKLLRSVSCAPTYRSINYDKYQSAVRYADYLMGVSKPPSEHLPDKTDLRDLLSTPAPEGYEVDENLLQAALLRGKAAFMQVSQWAGKNHGATDYEANTLIKEAEALEEKSRNRK